MNIGFDLDKIFVNHPPFIPSWLINKLYGEKINGHLSYRIPGTFEQKIRQLSHASFLRSPIGENVQILKKEKGGKGLRLFLISSRYSFLKKQTKALIEKNSLQTLFDEMYFNYTNMQPHQFKDFMVKKHAIKRYVDDDLPLLQYLAQRNPTILFFWLNPTRNDKLKKNLYAITNLSSVFEKI